MFATIGLSRLPRGIPWLRFSHYLFRSIDALRCGQYVVEEKPFLTAYQCV
jgi:hypothetical protein